MVVIKSSRSPSHSVVSIMNPPNSATVDDGRPAGGTARTSGTKTPRKVQWAFDEEHPVPSASSTHALDEHGLDVRLISYLFLQFYHRYFI